MEQAISHANLVVNRTARDTEALRGMGTTVVLAVAEGNTVTIAHAGDSRAYLIHGEELSQLTHDHTVVQMLMERGEITEEEASAIPSGTISPVLWEWTARSGWNFPRQNWAKGTQCCCAAMAFTTMPTRPISPGWCGKHWNRGTLPDS